MGTRMRDVVMYRWPELRYEPTEKRIRVMLGDEVLVDTTRALLVWEPRRIVPSYAVPVSDPRALPELRRRAEDHRGDPRAAVIEKILAHLGLQARAPPQAPARGPAPQAA
jgi:hypothetical protein